MNKINPNAIAECGDDELDSRPEAQYVDERMIRDYVISQNELPPHSARPFAAWLHTNWFDFNEDGDQTVGNVINGALSDWRGGK